MSCLDDIIALDQHVLVYLNNLGTPTLDGFMRHVTNTATWIPMAVALLYVIFRGTRNWRFMLSFVVAFALVVLFADQFSSGFCKGFFHRFRPTHEPLLDGMVRIVDNYRGGLYGFISSHAANTFAVATFVTLLVRVRTIAITIFAWACLSSYSRIYLGVHYPGDILCGALAGTVIGWGVYRVMVWLYARYGIVCDRGKWSEGTAYLLPSVFVLTLITIAII